MDSNIISGVSGWFAGSIKSELQRSAIFFDQLYFKHCHSQYECDRFSKTQNGIETLESVDLLKDKGIIVKSPGIDLEDIGEWLGVEQELVEELEKVKSPSRLNSMTNILHMLNNVQAGDDSVYAAEMLEANVSNYGFMQKDLECRLVAAQLKRKQNIEAIPIVSGFEISPDFPLTLQHLRKSNIVNIVYDQIPLPNPTTPWEAIFDFRNDEEGKGKLYKLKRWIARKNASELTINEIQDELNELLFDYSNYMEIQHKKFKNSKMEFAVTSPVEIIESIVKLQISKSLKIYFNIKRLYLELMESELKAPGQEIAFIAKAKKLSQEPSPPKKWWEFWKE